MAELGNSQILVLIPCLNEAGRIGAVVTSVKEVLPDAGVVVIDDASSDGSAAEARAAGATVLTHCSNLGYGASLETGYRYAVAHGHGIVLQMDADGQHLASELTRLLDGLGDGTADIVLGSRYSGADDRSSAPPIRRFAHGILARLLLVLTRLRLTDPTSGFQALNRAALSFFSSGVFPCDYPDSDVILMAHMAGLRIREVPVTMLPRASGKSMHSGLSPFYYAIKMILAMFIVLLNFQAWHAWRRKHNNRRENK